MRRILLLFFIVLPIISFAQDSETVSLLNKYKNCKTNDCQVKTSIHLVVKKLAIDEIDEAQIWLNKTKDLIDLQKIDTMNCYVHSLQSELFFYMGLHQFGIYEAKKEIEKALILKDSGLVSDGYLFLGLNQYELNQLNKTAYSFSMSKNFYPKHRKKNRLHEIISEEHIYNNISQLKLKQKDPDSAFYYNKKGYEIALRQGGQRVIANSEQAFGLIYLFDKKIDSAKYFLRKSIQTAYNSQNHDVSFLSTGILMECYVNDKEQALQIYLEGEKILDFYPVNSSFQRQFYTAAVSVLERSGNIKHLILAQKKILAIDNETRLKGNFYIQNITEQYVKNENKLLSLKIDELNKERNFTLLQLIAALLCVLLLLLTVIIIRRKNKVQHRLLEQKNEIGKDLHDDIGSGLSSILILADLLLKNDKIAESQKMLIGKIGNTGKEISQKLNTFIWSLNVENNNIQDFCEYVKKYAVNQYEATDVNFTFSEKITLRQQIEIDGNVRKNLFFCIKELLNNSMKHSRATEVDLTVRITEKRRLTIILHDNGIGINNEVVYGNGLNNIKKRVTGLGGTFIYKSKMGMTAEISITV